MILSLNCLVLVELSGPVSVHAIDVAFKTSAMDSGYTVQYTLGLDIKFGHFAVIFTRTTFSMISCC